jgi:hypothetical protein
MNQIEEEDENEDEDEAQLMENFLWYVPCAGTMNRKSD